MKRTKRTAKLANRKRERARKTKNAMFPAGSRVDIDFKFPELKDMVLDVMGDVMIRQALIGATENEKLLVAALIPILLKFSRGPAKGDLEISVREPFKTPPGRTDGPEAQHTAE